MNRIFGALALAVLMTTHLARAECYIPFSIPLEFQPRSLVSVMLAKGSITTRQGVIIDGTDGTKLGVVEVEESTNPENVIVLILGVNEEAFSRSLSGLVESGQTADCTELPDLIEQRDTEARKAENFKRDLAALDSEISRLKSDADIIGNISRIVTTEDDLESIKRQTDLASATKLLIEDRLVSIRKQSPPRSFARRESELSTQLIAFASAGRNMSQSSAARLSEEQQELNRKIRLIETTKNEHEELLKRQLARLRKEREQLERSVGVEVTPY